MPSPSNSHGTLTIYTNVDTKGLESGLSGITKTFNKLSSAMKMSVGIAGMLALGKSAVDAASDLKEYRNVAEVTFGSLIYMLDQLNENSIEAYGMSKLMATQAASGFMAMGNAAGIARKESAEMAIGLTKYMADFASFYNLSHERARTALAAVYTGETETLKQYGIMLQEVNLQQFENERGLGRSIKTMTAAEKAQLRYNYIMFVGKDAMGDFARTSDNWANQVKVLTERWKEFLIQLGSGLITVLTPLVRVLNTLIDVTMRYTRTLGEAISVIFGIDWQDISKQYSSMADGANDYADAEDAIADATNKSAKSANKALQSFDKLNVIRTADTGEDGESLPVFNTDSFEESADAIESSSGLIESAINSLFKLGQYMASSLQETLDGIDWDAVYAKFSDFGTGVADYLNGALSTEALSSVARTLAGTLNAIVEMAIASMTKFNWEELGTSIATSLSTFFIEFDTGRLAEALNAFVDGVLIALKAFVKEKPWKDVFASIADFLGELEIDTVSLILGTVVVTKLGKLLLGEIAMMMSTQLSTGIASALGSTPVINTITTALKAMFGSKAAQSALVFMFPKTARAVNGLTTRFSVLLKSLFGDKEAQSALASLFPTISSAIGKFKDVAYLTSDGTIGLGEAINYVFGGKNGVKGLLVEVNDKITALRNNMTGFAKGAIGITAVTAEFGKIKDAVYDVTSGSKDLDDVMGTIITTAGLAGTALYVAFGPAGIAFAAVTGIVAAVAGAIKGVEKSLEKAKLESLFDVIDTAGTVAMENLGVAATTMLESITANVDPTVEKLKSISTAKEDVDKTVNSIKSIATAIENGAYTVDAKVDELIGHFQSLLDQSRTIFNEEYDVIVGNIMGAWADILTAQGESVPAVVAALAGLRDKGTKAFSDIETQLNSLIEKYNAGTISGEAFLDASIPLMEQLADFNKKTDIDNTVASISELVGALDLSKYMNNDGSLDDGAFIKEIEKVSEVAVNGKAAIQEFGKESEAAILDLKNQLNALGIDTSAVPWDKLIGTNKEYVESSVAKIDEIYQIYASTVKKDLDKLYQDVADEAGKDWEDLNWYEKIFNTKYDYVGDVQTKFIENIYTPIVDALNDSFNDMGLSRNSWISNIEEALKGLNLSSAGSTFGHDVVVGFNEGLKSSVGSTTDAIGNWMKSAKDAIHDSDMKFGSPSRTAGEFGRDTVKGFNLGVSANTATTIDIIEKWMSKVMQFMTQNTAPMVNSIASTFGQSLDAISREVDQALYRVEDSLRRTTDSMYNTLSQFLTNTESLLNRKSGLLNFLSNMGSNSKSFTAFTGFKIPMLATGAVIPPNRQFLAMLGDQKHGTNVEAPLDTIKQALTEVMAQYGGSGDRGDIVIQISGREIARVVRDEDREHINRTGTSMFAY